MRVCPNRLLALCVVLAAMPVMAAEPVAIDFSTAGYGGNQVAIPAPAAVLRVRPTGGDDTAMLQAAIEKVGTMSVGADGFRGAIFFDPGVFQVSGQLRIQQSGIVLRGSATGITTIKVTGLSHDTLIDVRAAGAPSLGVPVKVADETVAAGAAAMVLESVDGLQAGDHVVITRPCTIEWVRSLDRGGAGGRGGGWTANSRELKWDRTVTAVDKVTRRITIDAPITTALERKYGSGTVARVAGNLPIDHVGIDHLVLESVVDAGNPKDEEHAWFGIHLDGVEDAWVHNVIMRHFACSAVHVGPRGRRITIADCNSEDPVSEIGNYRREIFLIEGQQVLVRGCFSEAGLNDFAVGLLAAGPNVFWNCESIGSLGASGGFESWASGVLYERVSIGGAALRLTYEPRRTTGAGWTAANSVVWNCAAKEINADGPASAPNLVVGGKVVSDTAEPLFEKQLQKRGFSLPELTKAGDGTGAAAFQFDATKVVKAKVESHPMAIVGGHFVVDGKTVWGPVLNEGWWRGNPVPADAQKNGGISASRLVPGREGFGLTENLEAVAAEMVAKKVPFYAGMPGLWYDRRRDQHSTIEQQDGGVLAPFLEWPWARSGQGVASDGLSKFDLTKFNNWYFSRYREMAQLCEQNGFVMVQHCYNSHDVLEIVPHWADYPMRPINNINNTGKGGGNIAEPPAVDPNKGPNTKNFHQANEVYDIDNPMLRDLHHRLIMRTLDALGDQPNVLLSLSFQFVGPLKFQQFFCDTVAEWSKAHSRQVKIAVITTKDITDAILADPVRSKQVAMIDTRYWQYRPDGSLFAPAGGQNFAFRESVQKTFPGNSDHPPPTNAEQAYRQVREYRDKYPELAISAWNNGAGELPGLMAGASMVMMNSPFGGHGQVPGQDRTRLDDIVEKYLSDVLMTMKPVDHLAVLSGGGGAPMENGGGRQRALSVAWAMADEKMQNVLVYASSGSAITLGALPAKATYKGLWIDPGSGRTMAAGVPAEWSKASMKKPTGGGWLLYLKGS